MAAPAIRGVLFDKDGTLIDFFATWSTAYEQAAHDTAGGDVALAEKLLALGGRDPVTLSAISQRQKISLSYLEQLFGKLRKNKIVDSVRGPGGWHRSAADDHAGLLISEALYVSNSVSRKDLCTAD